MKPRWMRRYVACPDCGKTFADPEIEALERGKPFDCPQCKAHYAREDFWAEQHFKWDRKHVPETD